MARRPCSLCARSRWGNPVGAPDIVLVNLDMFKTCMKSRGWQREIGSKYGNPPGYYRGLEGEGPVRLDEIPKQIPTMERR